MVIPTQLLSLMVRNNTDAGAILTVGTQYMFLMGFAGIPATICAVLASALREIGDVKPPLVISVSATLLNTFLDQEPSVVFMVFLHSNCEKRVETTRQSSVLGL